MGDFIRVLVDGTETLINLDNVVSIQFWGEGEFRRPHAALVTTAVTSLDHAGGQLTPQTLTVQDAGPVAALRAELRRVGALGDERERGNTAGGDATMPVADAKFDRSRPHQGYNRGG